MPHSRSHTVWHTRLFSKLPRIRVVGKHLVYQLSRRAWKVCLWETKDGLGDIFGILLYRKVIVSYVKRIILTVATKHLLAEHENACSGPALLTLKCICFPLSASFGVFWSLNRRSAPFNYVSSSATNENHWWVWKLALPEPWTLNIG